MDSLNSVHFIGCGVLAPDIKKIAEDFNNKDNFKLNLKMTFLPAGLHEKPNELRIRLQSAIDTDAQDENCHRIVIGYGICGRGTVGINAPHVPLFFPRVHDCIAMFMGSDSAYKREFAKYPGTFYLSTGWCKEKDNSKNKLDRTIWIGSEPMGCLELKERYGEEGGKTIIDFFSSWQKNYQRAAFIDTGLGNAEKYEKQAKEMAKEYNWKYERIQGDNSLMRRLLTQEHSDDAILIVPPHHCTIYCAFKNGLDSAPIIKESAEIINNFTPVLNNSSPKEEVKSQSRDKKDKAVNFLNDDSAVSNVDDKNGRVNSIDNEKDFKGLLIHYGLGIDAGGTYTDAVIYDFHDKQIVYKNKALTTKWDFAIGIDNALSGLNQDILSKVELVSVSTTLATNAIVEGEGQKTGLILMNSAGMVSDDLISHTPKRNIKGYINISGEEIEPVDEDEVKRVIKEMISNDGVTAFAVSGFGGSINPAHELVVKKIIEQESGMVACGGHELSDLLNFVVRAQTAVLNARIIPRMIKFFSEIDAVLKKRGISAPVMVVKGDGTLISSEVAREKPVETILSGPAASVAGAKILTGLTNAMVVDMGGTTTDTADICDNMVAVCESGASVGGFVTHVKALEMRTVGLGGDSLIKWKQGEFIVGPRRVAPIVWAGEMCRAGLDKALCKMEGRELSHLEQVVFVAMGANKQLKSSKINPKEFDSQYSNTDKEKRFPFKPTEQEIQIYDLLTIRPHTPEELAKELNTLSTLFLPMERLEESGLVQRCGLTPTDLLHVRGDFRKWNPEPAQRWVNIMAEFSKKEVPELIDELLEKIEKQLASELLKNLIFKDIEYGKFGYTDKQQMKEKVKDQNRINNRNGQFENEFEKSPLAKHLISNMLDPSLSSRYRIRAEFNYPVIGIGAPIHYFLPKVSEILNAKVVIPSNADVANALGAITSHIMVRQKVVIRPDSIGRFIIEGVAGNKGFIDINEAESWAVKYLNKSVKDQAIKAGTSNEEVSININDRVVNTGNGLSLFLDKTITATLTGSPDFILGIKI